MLLPSKYNSINAIVYCWAPLRVYCNIDIIIASSSDMFPRVTPAYCHQSSALLHQELFINDVTSKKRVKFWPKSSLLMGLDQNSQKNININYVFYEQSLL